MRHNSVVIDTTDGLIHFPHLTMQVKSASSGTSAKPQAVLIHDNITVPPITTKTITAFVDHSSEWNTTGTVTPVEKFKEPASLIIFHSISTITDTNIAVRVTNASESPYINNKNTQFADFSVVTPEQCKFIKPVDMAILRMIPEGDPDLITYLNELLKMKNQIIRTLPSGFRHLKMLAKLRIIPQFRDESSKSCAKCNTKKNKTPKITSNHECKF